MRNKIFIISGIIAIVLILVLTGVAVFLKKQTRVVVPPQNLQEAQTTPAPDKLITYKDTSGFKFDYPESLTVKDVSGNDQTVYSSLELLSAKNAGKMMIKITDTTFSGLEAWLESKEASGAGAAREITLAGMPGKQIQFIDIQNLVTIVIKDGIMYFLASPLESNWNKIHSDVLASFSLEQSSATGSAGDNSQSESATEEEEVIQ